MTKRINSNTQLQEEIKILGINGSPNKDGLCFSLLEKSVKSAEKEGSKIDIIHLVDYEKHFFNGKYTTRVPVGMADVFDLIRNADGIIFATPVHWFNTSSLMKNFIDQLTVLEIDNFSLEGKVGSFIASVHEDGGMQAVLSMAAPLNHMGVIMPPYSLFFHNKNMKGKSEKKWQKKDPELLGINIVRMVNLVKIKKNNDWGYK